MNELSQQLARKQEELAYLKSVIALYQTKNPVKAIRKQEEFAKKIKVKEDEILEIEKLINAVETASVEREKAMLEEQLKAEKEKANALEQARLEGYEQAKAELLKEKAFKDSVNATQAKKKTE